MPRSVTSAPLDVIDGLRPAHHLTHTHPPKLLDSTELISSAEGDTSYPTPDVASVVQLVGCGITRVIPLSPPPMKLLSCNLASVNPSRVIPSDSP